MAQLTFRISSALKNIIGKDLITDDYIAVFELVKNSYDAYATRVDITFENIYSDNAKILIKDNGKGMSLDDIEEKWLFVAYSAKKAGTEDDSFDYRDGIYQKRAFAGAKGIGRFSCDRLGRELLLESTKRAKDSQTELIYTDWTLFEKDISDEFIDVTIDHETLPSSKYGLEHGTVIEISNLRSSWDRTKLLRLKRSLAKLINPTSDKSRSKFKIYIHVDEELDNDSEQEDYNSIVNGEVQNLIFETLEIKTTVVETSISEDSSQVITSLFEAGQLIYKITEKNKYTTLSGVSIKLFYLNRSAKNTFTRRMGLEPKNYGHVLVYKNGFRIYPYGEPGADPFGVDLKHAQGTRRYLANRNLIGQINISSEEIDLYETSSRGDGFIKNRTYQDLYDYFWETKERLEKYVVEVQKWGLSVEEIGQVGFDLRTRIATLIANLTSSDSIIDFKIPDNFLDIIEASQESSAESVVKNLNRIAVETGDKKLIKQAELAAKKFEEAQNARIEAEIDAREQAKKAEEATRKLKDQVSENLFLKSINASDYEEVISLLHHIGIYAGTIDGNLKGISLRIQNNIPLTNTDLNEIIRLISFETKKIMNVVAFATKANFKLKTESIELDVNNYVLEYIQNIIPAISDKQMSINVFSNIQDEYLKTLKPIELNIVLDNLISNARKAKASQLNVYIDRINNKLRVKFEDDGQGFDQSNLEKIYNLGYTTTDGAGIGLYHVRQIIDDMRGIIEVSNNETKGATVTIQL